MRIVIAGAIALFSAALLLSSNQAGEKKAKFTIPEVMKAAHKEGLMQKVAKGKASDVEKEALVDHYVALSQNTPPKGEKADWEKRTGAIVAAAKKAAKGDEDAAKSLPKLANCAECHKLHK